MDQIQLTQIRCYGYTGYLVEEQVLGQWFSIDITLWLDLQPAGISDDINDTIDYRRVIDQVKEIVKNAKFALIEKLANEIAISILSEPKVSQVNVRLSKPNAPIPDFGGQITIDITRNKNRV